MQAVHPTGGKALRAKRRLSGTVAGAIVLLSAVLSFLTTPPRPELLFGILVAVILFWTARSHSLLPAKPHSEDSRACAACGSASCVQCHSRCPECGALHVTQTRTSF